MSVRCSAAFSKAKAEAAHAGRLTAVFLSLLFVISGCADGGRCASCFAKPKESKRTIARVMSESRSAGGVQYFWHAPAERPIGKDKTSFFVVFHPAGSSGADYLEKWTPLLGKQKNIILAPTADQKTPYSSQKFAKEISDLILEFKRRFGIQPDRVFLIGESNGAIFGYRFLADHPGWFRAAAFISGTVGEGVLERFRKAVPPKTSILVVHGTEDSIFDIRIAEKEVQLLRQIGLSVDFQKTQGMGHGADAFAEDELAKWFSKFEDDRSWD